MSRSFDDVFGYRPEAVASAPGRVNLLGEHTDYNDGFVLPLALSHRTTVSIGRASGTVCSAYSEQLGRTVRFSLDAAPKELFARYVFGCLHEAHRGAGHPPAVDIHVESAVPIGVGLSSSAALEVATLRAVDLLVGSRTDPVLLAQKAQRAEVIYAGVECGIMDQMAASLGDDTHALFIDTRSLETRPVALPADATVLVLDCGVPRSLADSPFNRRRHECAEACVMLGVASLRDVHDLDAIERLSDPWRRRARHVFNENGRVIQALQAKTGAAFGALMNASHTSLRDDFEVSVPRLDQLVALLQAQSGVHGARLTGAGFGGACIALCEDASVEGISQRVLAQFSVMGGVGRVLARCPSK